MSRAHRPGLAGEIRRRQAQADRAARAAAAARHAQLHAELRAAGVDDTPLFAAVAMRHGVVPATSTPRIGWRSDLTQLLPTLGVTPCLT